MLQALETSLLIRNPNYFVGFLQNENVKGITQILFLSIWNFKHFLSLRWISLINTKNTNHRGISLTRSSRLGVL